MPRYFLQHDTVKIIPLGECEDFSEADLKAEEYEAEAAGPSWILDEASLRKLRANISEVLL